MNIILYLFTATGIAFSAIAQTPKTHDGQTASMPGSTVPFEIPHSDAAFEPYSPLCIGPDGSIVGTARGSVFGTVCIYQMKPNGKITALATFVPKGNYNYGLGQISGLTSDEAGNYFGTTAEGNKMMGTIFKLSNTGTMTTLLEFSGTEGPNRGAKPSGELIRDKAGNLYGTTLEGGASNKGTVFKVSPKGELTTLVDFTGGDGRAKGSHPNSGVVTDGAGNFYGLLKPEANENVRAMGMFKLTSTSIFKLTASGILTELVQLPVCREEQGTWSPSRLTITADGTLYGTGFSETQKRDVIYKVTAAGKLTILAEFPERKMRDTNVSCRPSSLIECNDGDFYGTTDMGGQNKLGSFFKVTKEGVLITLGEFTGGPPNFGSYPRSGLVRDKSDDIFGATKDQGTVLSSGTIFRFSKDGKFKTVAIFSTPRK